MDHLQKRLLVCFLNHHDLLTLHFYLFFLVPSVSFSFILFFFFSLSFPFLFPFSPSLLPSCLLSRLSVSASPKPDLHVIFSPSISHFTLKTSPLQEPASLLLCSESTSRLRTASTGAAYVKDASTPRQPSTLTAAIPLATNGARHVSAFSPQKMPSRSTSSTHCPITSASDVAVTRTSTMRTNSTNT